MTSNVKVKNYLLELYRMGRLGLKEKENLIQINCLFFEKKKTKFTLTIERKRSFNNCPSKKTKNKTGDL